MCACAANVVAGSQVLYGLAEQETSLIGGFLNINLHKLRKDFLVRKMGKLIIKEKENFDCIFLNEEGRKSQMRNIPGTSGPVSYFPLLGNLAVGKSLGLLCREMPRHEQQ